MVGIALHANRKGRGVLRAVALPRERAAKANSTLNTFAFKNFYTEQK